MRLAIASPAGYVYTYVCRNAPQVGSNESKPGEADKCRKFGLGSKIRHKLDQLGILLGQHKQRGGQSEDIIRRHVGFDGPRFLDFLVRKTSQARRESVLSSSESANFVTCIQLV